MAKKRRYQRKVYVNSETLRGISVLFIFALAGILLLSIANLAGVVGELINQYAALIFGWDYFLVPIVLLIVAGVALYPDRRYITPFKAIGILLFFLSFNAIINLIALDTPNPSNEALAETGGLIGVLFQRSFESALGFWGAIFILFVLVFTSLLLAFNASLRGLIDAQARASMPAFQFLKKFSFRSDNEEEEEDYEEEEEENYEDVEVEEGDESEEFEVKKVKAPSRAKAIAALQETALTTRKQRKIEIPLDLLEHRSTKAKSGDIKKNKEIIEDTFREFGIPVEMTDIATGPTVTQYALRPPRGIKLTRIVSLQNDLALALAAHPIRIEAPIPGRSLVGIEVPNQSVATVSLREVLESKEFMKHSSTLTFGIGKDVGGNIWAAQLDRMPHLLVAGATGSGKSVCLNTIILSFLYSNGPDDLKLIMIDPKRVELTGYAGIPHLLVPPITKVEDAVNALKWTIREMERRLDVLSKFGTKDIKSFNKRSKERMPYIVVVIDELADLMMSSGREVESSIVRIAQLARATGIHLVIATQRPSVDVITGTIKANFPGRIAFSVASQTDSRTILDMAGAEKLLGRGDMLFTTAELSKPKRIQGAFVSEKEIEQVVKFLKQQGEPDYNHSVTERERSNTVFGGSDGGDEYMDEAIQYILQSDKASTSMLQRRLKIGYSRAARIMDILEDQGIIGPQEGSKPREVLIEEWPLPDYGDSIPTAEADYDEAAETDDEEDEEEYEDEEEDIDVASVSSGRTSEEEEEEEEEEDDDDDDDDDEEEYEFN